MAVPTQRFLSSKTRWVVFALIVVLSVYLLAVTPVRTYFDQRSQMQAAEDRYALLTDANKQMSDRVNELQSDAEISKLARERYELVPPGAEAYAVMPPPAVVQTDADKEGKNQSLWNKMWDSVSFWN